MRRDHWKRVNDGLDPELDFVRIYRHVVMHEFPWDMNQALSFALFRTYAVPGIGRLLDETGEFTGAVQKRYDDTALLLEQPLSLGFEHPDGRRGDPADQPDAPRPRHPRPRVPLCAEHLRGGPQAVARRLRQAAPHAGRGPRRR